MQTLVPIQSLASPFLSSWIKHQDPLTDKLQAFTGTTELHVLVQQWQATSWWDKYVLLIQDEQIFQREIIMKSQDKAYWYARTIIPESCYQVQPDFFKRLEHESIRSLIFDNQEVERVTFSNYPINQSCLEFHWIKYYLPYVEGILWVRVSELLFLNTHSFYLLEILLPELEQLA